MKRTRAFRLQWNIYRVRHRFPQTTIPLTEALGLHRSYQLDLSVARLTKQSIDNGAHDTLPICQDEEASLEYTSTLKGQQTLASRYKGRG